MKSQPQTIYIPDTRGVTVSRFGNKNLKLGPSVFTYSRHALVSCPGRSEWCSQACYALRIVPPTTWVYDQNMGDDVPEIPTECKVLRLHVSGDFDTVPYIENWIARLTERPDVRAWGYTRSWRVPALRDALERLRALPNVQLFASTDTTTEEPPAGWRVAWIQGDPRAVFPVDQKPSLVCPEELRTVKDCASCGYCWRPKGHTEGGNNGDVTFLKH